jgi:hypothetical protein
MYFITNFEKIYDIQLQMVKKLKLEIYNVHGILTCTSIGSPDMYVDFVVVSESQIALNTRVWKLSRSCDARVGIVITMIHCIYILR